MDRKKLNKAAIEFDSKEEYGTLGVCFIKGADWLMQQPLSERLTDAEKERIMGLVNYMGESAHDSEVRAMRDELENIFGADLFKEK